MSDRLTPMSKRLDPLVILLAALFAAEPILHTHPLSSSADASNPGAPGSACAVCATGVNHIAPAAPSVVAPTAVSYTVVVTGTVIPPFTAPLTLPSRAPPASV